MKVTPRNFLLITAASLFMLCTCWESGAQNAQPAERGKVCKVVLDPGHGGKDPGCVYRNYYEKDVTLGIAKKLGELIRKNYPDVEVIYTRSTDKYVELAERGKIANRANADLFISIHINAATNQNARGTSTHVMGMDKDGKNLEVAMRENDIIIYEDDYTTKYEGYNPGDPASYIMFSLMQYAYKDQSMMFAEIIQKHFKADLPMPDRGTTQEPFLVLWRTSMPSVLTEVGFLSNQTDRSYVTSGKGQSEAARALFVVFPVTYLFDDFWMKSSTPRCSIAYGKEKIVSDICTAVIMHRSGLLTGSSNDIVGLRSHEVDTSIWYQIQNSKGCEIKFYKNGRIDIRFPSAREALDCFVALKLGTIRKS